MDCDQCGRICPRDRAERLAIEEIFSGNQERIDEVKRLGKNIMRHERNRLIFDAILKALNDGGLPDRVTVSFQLLKWNKLEDAGGLKYIVALGDSTE